MRGLKKHMSSNGLPPPPPSSSAAAGNTRCVVDDDVGVAHATHMSQIAPNVISRDLAPLERSLSKARLPTAHRPPVSWAMPDNRWLGGGGK